MKDWLFALCAAAIIVCFVVFGTFVIIRSGPW